MRRSFYCSVLSVFFFTGCTTVLIHSEGLDGPRVERHGFTMRFHFDDAMEITYLRVVGFGVVPSSTKRITLGYATEQAVFISSKSRCRVLLFVDSKLSESLDLVSSVAQRVEHVCTLKIGD